MRLFNLLLNVFSSVLIPTTPAVISRQSEDVQNKQEILEAKDRTTDILDDSIIHKPTSDEIENLADLNIFYSAMTLKTQYNLLHAYKVLKKLLKINDSDEIDELPYKKYNDELNLVPDNELKNETSQYHPAYLAFYWKIFIPLFKQISFDYEEFLNKQIKNKNINSDEAARNEPKLLSIFDEIDPKYDDVYFVRVVALEFEAFELLNKHKHNKKLEEQIDKLLKVEEGTNPSSQQYVNTLKKIIPIITEIRNIAGESIANKLSKEVDKELINDKIRLEALTAAVRAKGSDEYEKDIKQRALNVTKNTPMEELIKLRDDAEKVYDTLKSKAEESFQKLKEKMRFRGQIDNAWNVKVLQKVYGEIVKQQISEFRKDTEAVVKKTIGSDMHDDFEKRLSNQNLTLEQLTVIFEEANNEFINEKENATKIVNSILDEKARRENIEKIEKSNNIAELKKIAEEAKEIRANEDLLNARKNAKEAVDKTVGSSKHDEYQMRLETSQEEIDKLLELIKEANLEYTTKKTEVNKILESLDDKKDFVEKFNNANNIEKLDKLQKILLVEKQEQDLVNLTKRAQKAVDQLEGSSQYDEFKKMLANAIGDMAKLLSVAEKAEAIYNAEKQKVLDIYNKLLDKKDYQARIDSAKNIGALKLLLKEITQEKKSQDNAKIKKDAVDAVNKLEGSDIKSQFDKELKEGLDDPGKLSNIIERANKEFSKEFETINKELDKLSDSNVKKKELEKLAKKAKNVKELRSIKLQIQKAILEQENNKKDDPKKDNSKMNQPKEEEKNPSIPKKPDISKKDSKSKVNVAAIATPLVVIPTLAGASVGTWYMVKRHRKNKKM
ncbi:hypothetical protein ACWXVM_01155 [Mycoplasma sp. 2261]